MKILQRVEKLEAELAEAIHHRGIAEIERGDCATELGDCLREVTRLKAELGRVTDQRDQPIA